MESEHSLKLPYARLELRAGEMQYVLRWILCVRIRAGLPPSIRRRDVFKSLQHDNGLDWYQQRRNLLFFFDAGRVSQLNSRFRNGFEI